MSLNNLLNRFLALWGDDFITTAMQFRNFLNVLNREYLIPFLHHTLCSHYGSSFPVTFTPKPIIQPHLFNYPISEPLTAPTHRFDSRDEFPFRQTELFAKIADQFIPASRQPEHTSTERTSLIRLYWVPNGSRVSFQLAQLKWLGETGLASYFHAFPNSPKML